MGFIPTGFLTKTQCAFLSSTVHASCPNPPHFLRFDQLYQHRSNLLSSSKDLHGSSDNEVLEGFLNCQLFDLCMYLLTRPLFATKQYILKRHVVIISATGEGCPAGGQQDGTDAC